ncbi:SDR family oxidoreductase [Pseudomonas oryzihabitans]|uniref:SDR family oxidoreductase n=1 Tax=Pseudomonas oryzihabitans TaxID=47885 RepID=UPI00123C3167|nr:SDR family oxidoreductase [Pseudomonas oryzihabitans]QEU01840.1 SDR family oxidoreductase [Pseudomonas oryzihabitans]
MSFEGKKVVILGGGSGMGLAVAKKVASSGGKVVIAGRNADKLSKVVATLGEAASYKAFDLGDEAAVKKAFEEIGAFDHLVTTAAQLTFAPVADLSTEQVESMLVSKFWGPFYASKYAAPHIAKEGSITFFSGLAAYRPAPGAAIVAALNAALEGFAMALALEIKPVRVNVVSPGVVDTPTWDFLSSEDRQGLLDSVASSLPVGRVGQADDLADAALALMGNGFINGTVLHVDGGGRIA